jgi:rRNA-processing protein FCF1
MEYTGRCETVNVEKDVGESCDDVVLRTAKEWGCAVATNDAKLRKRLRESGVTVVFVRKRSRLEAEGKLRQ